MYLPKNRNTKVFTVPQYEGNPFMHVRNADITWKANTGIG